MSVNKILSAPVFCLWAYYFLGPILNFGVIKNLIDPYMNHSQLKDYYVAFFISNILIFPSVIYVSFGVKSLKKHLILKVNKFFTIFIIISSTLYFFSHFIELAPNLFINDLVRARIYSLWINEYRILPLFIIISVLVSLQPNRIKSMVYVFIPLILIDIVMGRRHLIMLALSPIISNTSLFFKAFVGIIIVVITSVRHGFENIASSLNVIKTFFSESSMIFVSSSTHTNCNILWKNELLLHFERNTQHCRLIDWSAGGYLARTAAFPFVGVGSILVFSFFVIIVHFFVRKYIYHNFMWIYNIILFDTYLICFRDDMGNAIIFLLQYSLLIIILSFLIGVFKNVSISHTHSRMGTGQFY